MQTTAIPFGGAIPFNGFNTFPGFPGVNGQFPGGPISGYPTPFSTPFNTPWNGFNPGFNPSFPTPGGFFPFGQNFINPTNWNTGWNTTPWGGFNTPAHWTNGTNPINGWSNPTNWNGGFPGFTPWNGPTQNTWNTPYGFGGQFNTPFAGFPFGFNNPVNTWSQPQPFGWNGPINTPFNFNTIPFGGFGGAGFPFGGFNPINTAWPTNPLNIINPFFNTAPTPFGWKPAQNGPECYGPIGQHPGMNMCNGPVVHREAA